MNISYAQYLARKNLYAKTIQRLRITVLHTVMNMLDLNQVAEM